MRDDPNNLEKLMNFQSHEEDRHVNSEKMKLESQVINILKNKIKIKFKSKANSDTLEKFIKHVMGSFDVNGFELTVNGTDLMALYPTCAMMEHSCTPNTKHKFNSSRQLVLKAAVDIAEGDHISTMYTKILWGTAYRRRHLLENKYFMCQCGRCSDSTEFNTNFSALKCLSCNDGFVLPEDPLLVKSKWRCNSCKNDISSDVAFERTKSLEDMTENALRTPNSESLETLIKECVANQAHYNHFHLFKVRHTLLQLYGRGPAGYKEDVLKKKEKMCQEYLEVCSQLDPGFARLGPYAGVALYEYHEAVMIKVQKMSSKEYPEEKNIEQRVVFAKALLQRCIKSLQDEPEDQPEGKLRAVAQRKLTEIGLVMTDLKKS